MVLGIALALLAIAGIIVGVGRKSTALIVSSVVGLLLVIGVWVYFYLNPY